jgi:hypothetical protein
METGLSGHGFAAPDSKPGVGQGNRTTALAFASVLSRAALVARLATAEALALILAGAGMLDGCAAPFALAGVLAGATLVARLAAAHPLAGILSLTDVLFLFVGGRKTAGGGSGREPGDSGANSRVELSTIHPMLLWKLHLHCNL